MANDVRETQQGQSTELTTTNPAGNGQYATPAIMESVLGKLGEPAFHNFVGTPLEVWAKIAKATGPDVVSADKKVNAVIRLVNFYCHRVMIQGLTPGEYVDAVRVVLVDSEGQNYAFVSDGIAGDLARLISAFGMGPYTTPLNISIHPFKTRRGFNSYSIQPA